jgi:hypothetical protein
MVSSKVEAETTKKGKVSQGKTTKGEVERLDSSLWGLLKKEYKLGDSDILSLQQAKIPARVNSLPATLFRLFNEDNVKAKGLDIKDYEGLNEYPELVLYEGYRSKGQGGEFIIKKINNGDGSFLEKKSKSGEISDVGTIIPLTGGQKFLRGFGHFLMMGGFLLVIIVIVAIVILISTLTK